MSNKIQTTKLSEATQLENEIKTSIVNHVFTTGALLKKMRDEELYKAFGFGDFFAYVQNRINLKATVTKMYLSISENLTPYLSESYPIKATAVAFPADSGKNALQALSLHQLYHVSQLKKPYLDNLFQTGKTKIGNHIITLDELQNIKREQLAEVVQSTKKQYKTRSDKNWEQERLQLMRILRAFAKIYHQGHMPKQIKDELTPIVTDLDNWYEKNIEPDKAKK